MENPNPNVENLKLKHENISGRPSDGGSLSDWPVIPDGVSLSVGVTSEEDKLRHSVHFEFPPILERPASPTPLEDQRAHKNGRQMISGPNSDSPLEMMEMEDQQEGSKLQGESIAGEIHDNMERSYASAVQGTYIAKDKNQYESLEEEIALTEEDVKIDPHPKEISIPSEELTTFGPWMVATHKNRRLRKESHKGSDVRHEQLTTGTSRFHVLQELEEELDLNQQVAVQEPVSSKETKVVSNAKGNSPLMSSKKTINAPTKLSSKPGVVLSAEAGSSKERNAKELHNRSAPMVFGEGFQEVAMRAVSQGGNHMATLIVEEGQDLQMLTGGNIVRAWGVKQKRRTEVLSKGLWIQKKSEFKIPSKPTIAEWMSLVPDKTEKWAMSNSSSSSHLAHGIVEANSVSLVVTQQVTDNNSSVLHEPVDSSALGPDCVMQM
ncbi:hypothetical protein V6N13_082560 [Hibiscus sabdariffa]|uniref:Uncharacterized protein n=1 Tax=Hibiscus sabdariffa TaxID=183260 RepID=A0ABR2Q3T1_9ROSI